MKAVKQTTLFRDDKFPEVKGPYELPEGWRWVRLKEIVIEDRKQINPQEHSDKEFWLITMDCVESNTGKLLQKVIVRGKDIKSVKFYFNTNHILYGKLRPYLNKVYTPDGDGICTTEFIPLLPKPGIHRIYLSTYLRTQYVVDYAMKNLTGSRQPRVDLDAFFKLPVPLPFKNGKPDIEEQKRIVAKIEELFSKIDRITKLRRQAKEEAENLLKAALHQVFSKAGERGWRWVKLRDVFEIQQGKSLSPKSRKGVSPYPFLRTVNIKWGYVDISTIDYMDFSEEEKKKLSLKTGDLLVCEGGEVGRTAIWRGELAECSYQNHIHRLRRKIPNVLPEFVMYWMMYAAKVLNLFHDKSSNTTISNLSAKRLGSIKLPLPIKNGKPDLEEQKRIAAYLDKIAEKQRKLLELYEQTEKELEMMKQAILNKAFRGQL